MKLKKEKNGFIALMTAIVFSFVLMITAATLSQTSFFSRAEILDAEYKERSSALAEACVDTALLKLATIPGYNPVNECNSVGDICPNGGPNICSVVSVSPPALGKITIITTAVFPAPAVTSQGAVTNLQVIVDSTDLHVLSWNEVP